ncbi:MAG: bifunctional folylpolyglutamate synthase/dihydrofolate synthase [Nitrospiraceae bacterium]|nr:bifunctional folylpolyglutamate synthase/dihydrofolate synthase [Nitrospiraceae bacterium]
MSPAERARSGDGPQRETRWQRGGADYREALDYLYSLQKHGIKLGLENTRGLLAALGNPERAFRCIHVAGTNGKGSTSADIASILGAAGKRTGLFTSPHLLNFTERIKIDGEEITGEETVRLALEVKEVIGKAEALRDLKPTFFEFVTAMALLEFRLRGVEWAVLETGMGGRLDSTNVVVPEVSVITPVGIDHREFLGQTLGEIAFEKAGIIKPGVPVVLGPQKEDALGVFEETAGKNSSSLYLYGRDYTASIMESTAAGVTFDYTCTTGPGEPCLSHSGLFSPLAGDYQAANAAAAVMAVQVSGVGKDIQGFDEDLFVREGLKRAALPGRLELVGCGPEIRLDGAHNPEAARALAGALSGLFLAGGRRLVLVLGIMGDKDMDGIMGALLPLAWKTIFTAPAYGRAARPADLKDRARALGFHKTLFTASTVARAIAKAKGFARPEDLIVITGSFYTAGEAKMVLGRAGGEFSRLRETL